MNIANYINNNGELKQIKPDDLNCKLYRDRLSCPCCGVKVDWINGSTQIVHFRHHHGTTPSECDFYCNSLAVSTYTKIVETENIALYLCSELSQFYLALGLTGLSLSTIKEAQREKLIAKIENGGGLSQIEINEQNFAPNQIYFVKLNQIKEQYRIEYQSQKVPKEISEKWFKCVNGISQYRAIFYYNKYACKKVSTANGIHEKDEYYFLSRENICNNSIRGVIFKKICVLGFAKNIKLNLYKFNVDKITDEAKAFFLKMDMHIKSANPNIIPIWPPCVKKDHRIFYREESTKYFLIKNDPELGDNLNFIEPEKPNPNYLASYKIDYNLLLARIKHNNTGIIVIRNKETTQYFDLMTDQFNHDFSIDIAEIIKTENSVCIKNYTKVFVNIFRNNLLHDSIILKKETGFKRDLCRDEHIELIHGVDVFQTVEYSESISKTLANDDEESIRLKIVKNKKGQWITKPICFKWLILKYKKQPLVYTELLKYLNYPRIPLELYNFLRNSK